MKSGRDSHNWCMCVVVMAMVGWVGAGIKVVDGMHAELSKVVGRISRDAGALPECEVIH